MYIQLHDTVVDHPKTLKCAKDLGITVPQMVGHLGCLWSWALRMAPDGELSSFEIDDIEIGAKWGGTNGEFVATLEKHRYLDNVEGSYFLHDWEEYAEHLKARERKRRERERKKSQMSRDVTGRHRTSRDVTPCHTDQNRTEQKEQNRTEDSTESVSSQIQELEHRYSLELELIHEARNSCALSRKNGTMTDSVWLRVLQKLDKHPIESVLSACVTFCEKHADGEKDERYLLGIVKGETKKRGVTRSGRRMEKPQEVLDAERILRTATQSMLDNGERERCEAIIDNYNKRKDQ